MKKPVKRTQREKRLLLVMPAAFLLGAYSFFIAIPKQSDLQETVDELERVRSSAVAPEAAANSRIVVENAQRNLELQKHRLQDSKSKNRVMTQMWREPDSQLGSVQQITEAMEKFSLSVLSQDFETKPVLSLYLQELSQIMDASSGNEPIEYWQVEVEGGYFDLTNFLASIDVFEMKTIPISISMVASKKGDGKHSWKIVFMI